MTQITTHAAGSSAGLMAELVRPTRVLMVLGAVFMLSACADQNRESMASTSTTTSVTTANQAKAEADRALQQSQRAMEMAQQAQSAVSSSNERTDRMYQRGLQK